MSQLQHAKDNPHGNSLANRSILAHVSLYPAVYILHGVHNYHNQYANDSPQANISILPKINFFYFDIKLKLNLE